MDDVARFWADLAGRLTGPLTFRLLLQPTMATLYAIRDGMKDAYEGRPAYFWAIFTQPGSAWPLLREGKKAVGKVITVGILMDVIYQVVVLKWVYPLQLIVVVFVLAFLPYLLLRGPVNRVTRRWIQSGSKSAR
jgi:hypothetical protein